MDIDLELEVGLEGGRTDPGLSYQHPEFTSSPWLG